MRSSLTNAQTTAISFVLCTQQLRSLQPLSEPVSFFIG